MLQTKTIILLCTKSPCTFYKGEISLFAVLGNLMSILNNFWQCSSVGADVLISSGGGGGSVQFHSSNLKKLTTLLDFFQNSQVI